MKQAVGFEARFKIGSGRCPEPSKTQEAGNCFRWILVTKDISILVDQAQDFLPRYVFHVSL